MESYEDLLKVYAEDCSKYEECKGCPLARYAKGNFNLCFELSHLAHRARKHGFTDLVFEPHQKVRQEATEKEA